MTSRLANAATAVVGLALATWLVGCGGHEARTLKLRSALDAGAPRQAIAAINEELDVKSDKDHPKSVVGDDALLVLDRASVQQSLAQFALSKRDFEVADKAIDMLDLAHNAGDSIGQYVFSDSAGKYQAPPYEKLLVNTLNMLNYLELRDVPGALVEARRLAVVQRYVRDELKEPDNSILGLGALLAGFAYEQSGAVDEALRYYDEALQFGSFEAARVGVVRLLPRGSYRSPRLDKLAPPSNAAPGAAPSASEGEAPPSDAPPPTPPAVDDSGDVLLVVGHGRVPHKVAERIPIGLALTLVANDISPRDRLLATDLAAQGLVTWVNFPTLAPGQGEHATPACSVDGRFVQMEQVVDVAHEVRAEWKKIEGKVILSAITRMITRVAAGQGVRAAAGRDNAAVGILASLAVQGTLTALDTPDTRSWETLPARVVVSRLRLPPGRHRVVLDSRGWKREQTIEVAPRGFAVVSLMALR